MVKLDNFCKEMIRENDLQHGDTNEIIENSLVDISNAAVKIDDILESGGSDNKYLENIEKVFKVIKEINARVNTKKCRFY